MDVKRGHCWRCEKRIVGKPLYCKSCWIAVYCSDFCSVSDVFRHSVPECEDWGLKRCRNSKCKELGSAGQFFECSSCVNAWYCGRHCQNEDWDNHRERCRKQSQDIRLHSIQIGFTLHDKRQKPLAYPFYIGNAIAVDMLNLENNECIDHTERSHGMKEQHAGLKKGYSILSVGCGNLRNFIHTIACLSSGFQGTLHTTLNDYDPFIQARNVFFLFMMIAFAGKDGIAGIVTTIWYSLHLSKEHYDFLADCLHTLSQISKKRLADMTRGMIDISERDLSLLQKVWHKWLSLQCNRRHPSYINLRKQRRKLVETESNVTRVVDEYKGELDPRHVESFEEWMKHGIFLGSAAARERYLEYGNPTMTGYMFVNFANVKGVDNTAAAMTLDQEKSILRNVDSVFKHPEAIDFVYCVPPDLHPFGTWDHLLVQKFCSTTNSLIDMYYSYITDQIQTTINALQKGGQLLSINIAECNDLARSLQQSQVVSQFDRIFTSNISDYVGTQKLLATFKRFLNTSNKFATIVTQHWNWYMYLHEALANDIPLNPFDHQGNLAIKRALIDTGKRSLSKGHYQEYVNSTGHFVSYLRADFTACTRQRFGSSLATYKDVKESSGVGLRMRDFRKELNTVVPFQYRRNVRQVNMLRGQMAHMVEWYIPS